MSLSEELGKAAAELENAADEAVKAAKSKYEEKVTPEKRALIRQKIDEGINETEKLIDIAAQKTEQVIKDFTNGYNSVNGGKDGEK